jgi:hypothetical protein
MNPMRSVLINRSVLTVRVNMKNTWVSTLEAERRRESEREKRRLEKVEARARKLRKKWIRTHPPGSLLLLSDDSSIFIVISWNGHVNATFGVMCWDSKKQKLDDLSWNDVLGSYPL